MPEKMTTSPIPQEAIPLDEIYQWHSRGRCEGVGRGPNAYLTKDVLCTNA